MSHRTVKDSFIWLGRRLGCLARFPEAIDVFSGGLEMFPDSYKLFRYRGRHRARNREFEGAIADYRRAAELIEGQPDTFEPDGIRSGPRNLDSGLSEIFIVFQAAVPKLVASKYTTSGVRRPSAL